MKRIYILLMVIVYIVAYQFDMTDNGFIVCLLVGLLGLTVGEICWWGVKNYDWCINDIIGISVYYVLCSSYS